MRPAGPRSRAGRPRVITSGPSSTPTIDFTMMYATHRAFRRDLGSLIRAAATRDADALRARWGTFKTQLAVHHSVEDAHLWPAVRRAASGRAGAAQLLDDMAREHEQLEPLLDAADPAVAAPSELLLDLLERLQSALTGHLDHEERAALPLVQAVCTRADWRRFAGQMRRRQGIRGAAAYLPWVLEGLEGAERRALLAALPPPVRLVNRLAWERRYRRRLRTRS